MKLAAVIYKMSLVFLPILINCSSVANYFIDRGRDTADIINLGVEKNVYGFSFHFLGAPIGIQNASSGKGVGIKFGHFGYYETGDETDAIIYPENDKRPEHYKDIYKGYKFGDIDIFKFSPEWNSYYHKPSGEVKLRNWRKRFLSFNTARCANYMVTYQGENSSSCGKFYYEYSGRQIEISIGAYLGIRIGFNINEFFDLLFGIFGFDIQSDDIGKNPELNKILNSPSWESSDLLKDALKKANKKLTEND